ncbi:MAG: YdaU family protein [Geminicoccaceae bacterium]
MADFPHMDWYCRDYIADTRHLTPEQKGAYTDLLNYAWLNKAQLVDNDAELARMCGFTLRRWMEKIRPAMERFWTIENGIWFQERQQKEFHSCSEKVSKNRANAALGGKAKALNANKSRLANASQTLEPKAANTEAEAYSKKERVSDSSSPHPPGGGLPLERFPVFDRLPKGRAGKKYPVEFEMFWEAYPQRGSDTKKDAYQAWRKPATNGVGPEALLNSAAVYQKFIDATNGEPKMVSRWVNVEGWTATYEIPERNVDERTCAAPASGTHARGQHKGPASFVEASREVLALRSRQS